MVWVSTLVASEVVGQCSVFIQSEHCLFGYSVSSQKAPLDVESLGRKESAVLCQSLIFGIRWT